MKKVSKIKLKPKFASFLKIVGVFFCVVLGLFLFYMKQVHDLTKLDYSKKASHNILFSFHKDYVLSVGRNETLNKAFESEYFKEEYMDSYTKINFVDQKHFIQNINKFIKIGYSNNDINIIFAHGDDDSVSRFAKREKIKYLEEFYTVPYAKLDYYDRYVQYSDDTGEDEDTTVLLVNLDLDKEDYTDSSLENNFSSDMLVNKHHQLSDQFIPDDLVSIPEEYASEDDLECSQMALNAFKKMSNDASREGHEIVINSAYRSYEDQVDLENFYRNSYGQSYVDKYVAKPGYSEHQTGLAFDVGSRKVNVFANSKEYEWMLENAYKYGFILRFPKKYEGITGFRNEPWHFRYVGEKIAKEIYDEDMSFEEYWAIYLDK